MTRRASEHGDSILNDSWLIQLRDVATENDSGDGGEFTYNNLLEQTEGQPISPPRGTDWIIHGIQYTWQLVGEDGSGDSPTDHLQWYADLGENDVAAIQPVSSDNATLFEFGARAADPELLALSQDFEHGPWITAMMQGTTAMNNITNGSGASRVGSKIADFWQPPEPVRISDRVELDLNISGHYALEDTAGNGDYNLQGMFGQTVWYKEIDVDDSGAR